MSAQKTSDIVRVIMAAVNVETQKAMEAQLSPQNLLKLTSPITPGRIFRIRDLASGLSWDNNNPETFHAWDSFVGVQQQWIIEPGVVGYRLKNPQSGRYVASKPDSFITGTIDSTQEFKFEGSPEWGYHIIEAGNTGREIQFQEGVERKGAKFVLKSARSQRWSLEPF